MKQTAVEWLYNKFSTCTSDELVGNINNWFEQAKAMEKEQIIDAYNNGDNRSADLYYNETFKSE
jgi:hypothetical protein